MTLFPELNVKCNAFVVKMKCIWDLDEQMEMTIVESNLKLVPWRQQEQDQILSLALIPYYVF